LRLSSNQAACSSPILLPRARCYSDASIIPDTISSNPRKAGLGIFVLDPSHQIKFYIKAQINHATTILMAEAAAITLTAWITSLLHINNISFLIDNQLLVNFFNGSDLSSPPCWDINTSTQRFLNAVVDAEKWRAAGTHNKLKETVWSRSRALPGLTRTPDRMVVTEGVPVNLTLQLTRREIWSLI